jgi:hypothetical protein
MNLKRLFDKFGAPVILKRDNGKNLNDKRVNTLLDEYGVIPLTSPVYDPAYNGGIENAQGEIKTWINEHSYWVTEMTFTEMAWAAVYELNELCRPVLGGQAAHHVFSHRTIIRDFGKRRRKEVRKWVENEANSIMTNARGYTVCAATAWRRATRNWLVANGHLVIVPRRKSVTLFPAEKVS